MFAAMARRPRLFAPGLLYHVIVRGNQRQKAFLNHGITASLTGAIASNNLAGQEIERQVKMLFKLAPGLI
jgi:REP element-mobilizing transposase RayT